MKRLLVCALLVAAACRAREDHMRARGVAHKAVAPAHYALGVAREVADFPGRFPSIISGPVRGFTVSYVDGDALRYRIVDPDGTMADARTIPTHGLIANSADAPSIAAGGSAMYAQWQERSGRGSAIRIARTSDDGATWSAPVQPHPDMKSEFGFVSMLPTGERKMTFVWLDGRKLEGGEEGQGDMQLRAATLGPDDKITGETLIDPRVCDCCQTSLARAGDGIIVAYRDRSPAEIRDIAVARLSGVSNLVHADGYHIEGCPVNGPSIDALDNRSVVAWFTAAGGTNQVNVAFSGAWAWAFESPITLARGNEVVGRVDARLLPDGSAIVTWVEMGARPAVMAAQVRRDGTIESSQPVTRSAPEGFPRIALSHDNVAVAWTAAGSPRRVRLAMISLQKK